MSSLSQRIRDNVAASRKSTAGILGISAQVLMSQNEELHLTVDDTTPTPAPVGKLSDRIRKLAKESMETTIQMASVTDEMCNTAAKIAVLSEVSNTPVQVSQKFLSE